MLDAAKFRPPIFSVLGFAFSNVTNVCIFMILYDLCLLPAQFHYVTVNIRYLKSHVQLTDQCAPWKFSNGADMQALQLQKVGVCRKFPGWTTITVITDLVSASRGLV
jgi:hypothetical protein